MNLLRIASRLISERTSLFLISSRLVFGSRKDGALKKYPEFSKEIELFEERDPAKNLKYLDWELKILNSGQALAPEICDVVDLFHKYKANLKKHDLKQYDDFTELRDTLFEIEESRKNKKKKVDDRYRVNDACETDTVYEKDSVKVLLIKNKTASVHHGLGTKWCISMKNRSYFDDYDSSNVIFFFVLVSKDSEIEKFALSYQRDKSNKIAKLEIFDSSDAIISKSKFNKLVPNGSEILSKTKSIAESQPKSILAKLASNEATPEEITKAYEWTKTQDSDTSKITFKLILESSKTPPEILTELSRSKDKDIRSIVAENPNTPSEALVELSRDKSEYVLSNVVQNPNTPPEILSETLTRLSHDETEGVRSFVAINPNTPVNILIELSHDKGMYVRSDVAQNLNATPEILTELSHDVDHYVRGNVAKNLNTPVEILTELSRDKDKSVQGCVAKNPNTPIEILTILSRDENTSVRIPVAKNLNTPIEILTELSQDKDVGVRVYVATNPNTPIEILTELSNDENKHVRNTALEFLKKKSTS